MTEDRLSKYALAAGTTIAVAAAGSAHAGIVSSVGPVNVAEGDNEVLFNFGLGGIRVGNEAVQASFNLRGVFVMGSSAGDDSAGADLRVSFLNNNNVDAGMTISTAFSTANDPLAGAQSKTGGKINPGPNPYNIDEGTNELLAFRMKIFGEAGMYFGWIDYTLDASGGASDPYTFTINAWAYNDVADQGIIAGEARAAGSSGGAAVPGLGGLAALAIGAAGVRTRRQRIS
jgi:hypothetical protein